MQRWSRACGSGGIGYSGAINEYREGVLQANWVEDNAGRDFARTGRSTYGFGGPLMGNSTQRIDYNAQGKTGVGISQRQDRELANHGLKGDLLMRHGDFSQPRTECFATLNQLTYGEKQLGEPPVDTYLWSGSNQHNRTVPLQTTTVNLTTHKRQEWDQQATESMYNTTTRNSLHAAALTAAEFPCKQGTLRPTNEKGQVAHIGRKPLGDCRDECDKNYRQIGMRDIYYAS